MEWARILAYITGTVDQELLLRNEYLAQVSRLLANRFIFTQGDRTRHFYLIEQGSVRVFYQSRNGSEFTICQHPDRRSPENRDIFQEKQGGD